MSENPTPLPTIGWIGAGRMGTELCRRVIAAGHDVALYNRTPAKAQPLIDMGARAVDTAADLADREVVFTMVADPAAFLAVTIGEGGVLTNDETSPAVLVDSSTIDLDTSAAVRARAETRGTEVVAAPVSGNPGVIISGNAVPIVSGSDEALARAWTALQAYGRPPMRIGEGDSARVAKIAHNLLVASITQCLAETSVLCEKAGVGRAEFLALIDQSPLGSAFTRYKTEPLLSLDFEPTFTASLLRKDVELGLALGRSHSVPLPTASVVHAALTGLVGTGLGEVDFAALVELQARLSGHHLEPAVAHDPEG